MHWVLRYMHCAFAVVKKKIYKSLNSTVFHDSSRGYLMDRQVLPQVILVIIWAS